MHGRPRQKGPPDPERVEVAQKKATLYGQLAEQVLGRRRAHLYDSESLALSAKLLELNPEVYTVWNYRREALAPIMQAGGDAAVTAAAAELALTERALRRNPKSYATWHHRRWVVAHRYTSLEAELALVGALLDVDARNFHGWGYRRFVAGLMGELVERELAYTEVKINQNFSNYSAWHNRTSLLPALHTAKAAASVDILSTTALVQPAHPASAESAPDVEADTKAEDQSAAPASGSDSRQGTHCSASGAAAGSSHASGGAGGSTAVVPRDALDREYELVKQAFFTEPEDQSGWFYHRWLLGCSVAHWEAAGGEPEEGKEREALQAVLEREAAMCLELLELEPEAKWPMLTLVRLRELQAAVTTPAAPAGYTNADEAGGQLTAAAGEGARVQAADMAAELAEEIQDLYARLEAADPQRAGYYRDARRGEAQVVAPGVGH